MNPRIKKVQPLPNFRLQLTFTNGEKGIYDCSPLLDFGVFQELTNNNYFEQVQVLDGTVAWPHGQDICPDTLYLMSKKARRVSPTHNQNPKFTETSLTSL
ncbi:MAG: DUF2442 domain-containing protein [Snowella sp.]|jgi:hypothetical protein|nr:DUF2442 domain-containing protein [Snowella sp.]